MPTIISNPIGDVPTNTKVSSTLILGGKSLPAEGATILSLHVGIDGAIKEVKIEQSSGYPKLDDAAIDQTKTWKLNPATRDGKHVQSWWKVKVSFKLQDNDAAHDSETK